MKIIHIISGVLLFLLIAVSTASAALSDSNVPGATDKVSVSATYSGNVLTVQATPKDPSVTSVRIDEIGINHPASDVSTVTGGAYNVLDNLGVYWILKGGSAPYQIDNVGQYASAFTSSGSKATSVTVNFINSDAIPANGQGYEVAAHVAWAGTVPGDGTFEGSAFFAGDTQIPEFPTIALPVAAILGLMFIIQRRKEN